MTDLLIVAAEAVLREATQPNPHMTYWSVPDDAMRQLRRAHSPAAHPHTSPWLIVSRNDPTHHRKWGDSLPISLTHE